MTVPAGLRPWLGGLAVALVVAGPALGPGILLDLDLVLGHEPPVPPGVWGLGPELPRSLPYGVVIAWLGDLLDGALVGKAFLVGVLVLAFVGAHRLAAGAPAVARVAAGLVYAAGPFLVTRLAIGHWGTALAAALLPFALPRLLRPADDVAATFLWCAALALGGVNGGLLAGAAALTGLVADRGRRAPVVVGAFLLAQLPWLVPGLVVAAQGVAPADSTSFGTRLDGVLGLPRVLGGGGFWIPDFDVGDGWVVVPLAGLALVVLAGLGHHRLPAAWRDRGLALALVGLAVVLASGAPGVDTVYRTLADTTLGGPLREGHRVLPLFLVWLAPAAAHGAARLGDRRPAAAAVALAAAVLLVAPSVWGFGGLLAPVREPASWAEARRVVTAEPGPLLALPWGQYLRPTVTDGRLVHQPLPYVLGGDVLVASGRARPDSPVERADPRLDTAGEAALALAVGDPAGDLLARIGVRWVALVPTIDPSYPDLGADPDLEPVVVDDDLALYRVRTWPGAAVDPDGEAVAVDPVVSPWARTAAGGALTWFRPGADGWRRGTAPVTVDDAGNLAVPAGSGPLWYGPTVLVLAADGITVGAVALAARRKIRVTDDTAVVR